MQLTITGIGPGHPKFLTKDALDHLEGAQWVIGAERQMESVKAFIHAKAHILMYSGALNDLKNAIETGFEKNLPVTVLASGDPNFYGITSYLRKTFIEAEIRVISGLSSAQYLFSKVEIPMHDTLLTSVHGRPLDMTMLLSHKRIGLLTDKKTTPYVIATQLLKEGANPLMVIGEELSYPTEQIQWLRASEVKDKDYRMNVVIIDYER